MCGGVNYTIEGKKVNIYFPNPEAKLPILMKDGGIGLYSWGRRKEQAGRLPLGGWARLESIKAGKWDYMQTRPVKIPVNMFMEKDHNKESCWFDMEEGTYLQGLFASLNDESRIYVVTVEPDEITKQIHDRWPRIIGVEN